MCDTWGSTLSKKKIVYECSICSDKCPTKEFDSKPEKTPEYYGKAMTKVTYALGKTLAWIF